MTKYPCEKWFIKIKYSYLEYHFSDTKPRSRRVTWNNLMYTNHTIDNLMDTNRIIDKKKYAPTALKLEGVL